MGGDACAGNHKGDGVVVVVHVEAGVRGVAPDTAGGGVLRPPRGRLFTARFSGHAGRALLASEAGLQCMEH